MPSIQTTTHESTFHRETTVTTPIQAPPEKIMTLLTQADTYTHWNTTIVSLQGTIRVGETLKLVSTLDPKRTFTLNVSELTPVRLVWKSGFSPLFVGKRTFTLTPLPDGSTEFLMKEEFTGWMLPLIKGSLPDFRENFRQYAADLKKAAE